ncbi:hypothetical protein M3Y97_01027400 [Aphelenchoides bicaudatus]|nr:hypothetical protein M3Y97_01027400 [Aphelenchoides bicaudatus]
MFKLGSSAPENGCTCANKRECENNGVCNCASSELKTFASDVGTFFDNEAGIQMLYVKRHENPGSANITIGPLECYGDSGHDPEKTWTLKSPKATLNLGTRRNLRYFELEFRTAQKDIPSLLVGNPISGDLKTEKLLISLSEGHKLEFTYNGSKENFSFTIMSQASLNDLKWHRLLIEILRQEIRFSVDHLNTFYSLDAPGINFQLQVGNETNGFVGCIRGIRFNNVLVNLDNSKIESDIIKQGCSNLCQESRSKCEQNARCIEHFDTGTTSCECKNNLIHYGERCEKNINVDSEISFHDKTGTYLKFKNDELAANPLNSSIVFSIRTDQKQALFIYAHDHFDNFLQVHLENEYKIVLTLNNGTDILRCAIYSEDSSEFSNMRWLQILVEQTPEHIRLHVDDAVCELPGPHRLANEIIAYYSGELGDAILPPQSVAPAISIQPYHLLFVGGVPSVTIGRIPRSEKQRRRERIAYYLTGIPALLGCIRGFMLGEQLDLRRGGSRPEDPDSIQSGCLDECNSLQCANGGHCTVRWDEKQVPGSPKLTECDCSKTSYYGSDCTKDIGVSFGGKSSLLFNMTEPRRFYLDESDEQSFTFAFSPRARKLAVTQRLATIIFDDRRQFTVDLCKNGSINVGVLSARRGFVYTFGGNFTDGLRHFFQSSFVSEKPILLLVDGEKKFISANHKLHLADAKEFWFGGIPDDKRLELSPKHNYEGCMSNIDIDFHKVEDVHFRPLVYYHDPTEFHHKSVRLHPHNAIQLAAARCARFKLHGTLPIDQRNIQLPIWEALFVPVPFNDTDEIMLLSPFGSYEWIVYIGLGVIIFVLIMLIVFCCYCCLCPCRRPSKSASTKRTAPEPERTENGKSHSLLTDSITYIKPDAPLLSEQKKSTQSMTDKEKTVSVASTGTYFTAPEQPLPISKHMTESQITATALDSDDETLTAYDDRPLSVISAGPAIRPLTSQSKSPPPIMPTHNERSAPSLSTFMNADELQPEHPLPSGRLSPYLPSLRSTLRKGQAIPVSPGQQRLIPSTSSKSSI